MTERRSFGLLAILMVVHGLAFFTFVLSPQALLVDAPILSFDYPYHWVHARSLPLLLETVHRPWGWDPSHMAGHPKSTLLDADAKAWQLFAHGLAFMGRARAFNLFAVLAFLLWPLAAWGAARLLGSRPAVSLLAAALAGAHLWTAPWEGNPCWYLNPLFLFRSGLVSFLLVSALFPLFVAVTERFLSGGELRWWFAMAGGAALLPTIHVFAIPMLATAAYFGLARLAAHRDLRRLGGALLAVLFAVGANLWWIRPFLAHRRFFLPLPADELYFVDPTLAGLSRFFSGAGPRLAVLLLVLGATGAFRLARRRPRDPRLALAASGATFFLFGALGSLSRLFLTMEPQRFLVPAVLCLLPVAAWQLDALCAAGLRACRSPRPLPRALLVALLPMLAFGLFGRAVADVALRKRYALRTEKTFLQERIVAMLRRHVNDDARVLVEASPLGDPTPWGDSRFPLVLPTEAPGQYLGTTTHYAFLKHRFPDFADGRLAGISLNRLDHGRLRALLERYNVGWILCWSLVARHRFELNRIWFERLATAGPFALYRVTWPPSWFHGPGQGQVEASLGRIRVRAHRGPKDCVLRYRWSPTLRLGGRGTLDRAPWPPDPVGFIRVRDAGEDFEIVDEGELPRLP